MKHCFYVRCMKCNARDIMSLKLLLLLLLVVVVVVVTTMTTMMM